MHLQSLLLLNSTFCNSKTVVVLDGRKFPFNGTHRHADPLHPSLYIYSNISMVAQSTPAGAGPADPLNSTTAGVRWLSLSQGHTVCLHA